MRSSGTDEVRAARMTSSHQQRQRTTAIRGFAVWLLLADSRLSPTTAIDPKRPSRGRVSRRCRRLFDHRVRAQAHRLRELPPDDPYPVRPSRCAATAAIWPKRRARRANHEAHDSARATRADLIWRARMSEQDDARTDDAPRLGLRSGTLFRPRLQLQDVPFGIGHIHPR